MPERSKGSHSRCDVETLEGSNPSLCIFLKFQLTLIQISKISKKDFWYLFFYENIIKDIQNILIQKMRRSVRKIELIPNFAEKILDAEIEMKLSDHPPKQTIGKLIQLYTLGVEYYQSIRSHKYMYFQIKLNQLFVSAANFASDSPKEEAQLDSPVKRKLKSNSEQEKIQALKIREKQAKMRINVVEKTNQSMTNKHVKTIIQESKNNEKFQKEKLDSQISKQEQKLTKKLEKRKSRILHSRSLASMMDGASTQQSLFLENENKNNKKPSNSEIKPLEINFNDIIKENDSDNEGNETEETPKKQIEDNPEGKVQLFTKKIDI